MTKIQKIYQLERTFEILKGEPMTMLQVARLLDIERANVCRYVGKLRKSAKIAVVRKGYCPITQHEAGFLTTDPAKFPKPIQLTIFE